MSVGDYQDHSFLSILSKSIGDSYTNEINNEESKTQPYSKNESEDENNDKKNIELYEANNVILIKKQKDEIQFFIHKKGYTPRIYKGKKCTKIRDILKKYIENNYTVDYMINVYKEGCDVFGKENELVEKLFNIISTKKEDEIKNLMKKLSPKDKNNVIKILEDIEFNQWKINPEIIGKLKDFIK